VSRQLVLALIVAATLVGCGKKKPVPVVAPPPAKEAPVIVPKKVAPPPPLSADQKFRIAGDFDNARKVILEARDFRLKGEAIERKDGREAANDTYVQARKRYRQAAQMTEKWIEPEAPEHEVSQRQVDLDPELKTYFDERGRWIQEDASMGQKLNYR